MNILCVIPSRMASTRLARKPVAMIQGKPMIQRVYEAAHACQAINRLVVATDNNEIADIVRSIGGEVAMTDPELATGTDRVATVAKMYPEMNVIINLQGDQPFVKPSMLESLVEPFLSGEMPVMTTLACPLLMDTEYNDPNVVKVLVDKQNYALYFSRSPIPYFRGEKIPVPVYHHLGVYAFQRDFLLQYPNLPQTQFELAEALEQLRALEHGFRIRVCYTENNQNILEINTPEELALAQTLRLED